MSDSRAVPAHQEARVTIHSLLFDADTDEVLTNHRAFARIGGHGHRAHRLASVALRERSRLIYKYSKMLALLRSSDERDVLVFVDDSFAFAAPGALTALLGERDWWLCQSGHHPDRGEGSLFVFRGGARAAAIAEQLLERCEATALDDWTCSRWAHDELVGMHTHPHHEPVEGRYANLLFPSFGHAFPGVSALGVTFNPQTHPNLQDHRSNRIVIAHLTECLERGEQPFAALAPSVPDEADLQPFYARGRVALVLALSPQERPWDGYVVRNVRAYAEARSYSLFVERAACENDSERLAAMTTQIPPLLATYEFVVWLGGDLLFHDQGIMLPSLFADRAVLLNRDCVGQLFATGVLGLRKDPAGFDFLESVLAAADRDGVDRTGQNLAAFRLRHGPAFADCMSLAAHPSFYDGTNPIVDYDGYPANVRHLVIAHDVGMIAAARAAALERRSKQGGPRTFLSRLRSPRLNTAFTLILFLITILTLLHG